MALSERLADRARRCEDLSPLAESTRSLIWQDNQDAVMSREDGDGRPVAPLALSTLHRRNGSGPERAPQGIGSRIISGLVVSVVAGVGRLSYTKSWPTFDAVIYHITGTRRMPRRDPSGVRPHTRAILLERLGRYIRTGEK